MTRELRARRSKSWRRAWRAASTIDDLAACTVAWLDGDHRETPGHAGPPDPETDLIRTVLATINRAGVVTLGSQPQISEKSAQQRAFLDLVGPADQVARVDEQCRQAGLHAHTDAFVPSAPTARRVRRRHRQRVCLPVTRIHGFHGWSTISWSGCAVTQDEAWPTFRFVPSLQAELDSAVSLSVVDPAYRGSERLWEIVVSALAPDRRPG